MLTSSDPPVFAEIAKPCSRIPFQKHVSNELGGELLGSKTVATKLTLKTSEEESENISTTNTLSENICFYEELCGKNTRHQRKTRIRSLRNDRTSRPPRSLQSDQSEDKLRRYIATERAFQPVAT